MRIFFLEKQKKNLKENGKHSTNDWAIINATTFVGGSYLAKYLSGSSDSDEEKRRLDLAVEKYQKEYEEYEENRAKLNDWIMTNDRIKR